MTIQYSTLGMHRQLNQIVMAGSHDAGINKGAWHIKTQSKNIGEQAAAGVRIFDLRIAAVNTSTFGGGSKVELRAFHADANKKSTQTRTIKDLGTYGEVQEMKLHVPGLSGGFGDGLTNMLTQARTFVEGNPSEFLILKFDKCTNWIAIAQTCVRVLGESIYDKGGNLNTKTLADLAGTVIVCFTSDGVSEAAKKGYGPSSGIMGIRRVDTDNPYEANYQGLQYCGKGGTSVGNVVGDKTKENKKKQARLMSEGATGNPDVMGMMYWTTTGLIQSIHRRNVGMWTGSKTDQLRELWEGGLSESIQTRLGSNIDPANYSSGGLLKAFMPNFVMIDFAKEKRCEKIFELNTIAATQLTAAASLVNASLNQASLGNIQRRARR
jgi:hypothetical protein